MGTIHDILLDVIREDGHHQVRLLEPSGEQAAGDARWIRAPRQVPPQLAPPVELPRSAQSRLIALRRDLRRLWIHGPDEVATQGWERTTIPGMPGRVAGQPLGLDEDLQVLRWAGGAERWPPGGGIPRGDRLGILVLSSPRHCDLGGTPIPGVRRAASRALDALDVLQQQDRATVSHVALDEADLAGWLEQSQDPVHLLIYIGHSVSARADGEVEVSISLPGEDSRVTPLEEVLRQIAVARGEAVRAVFLDSCNGADAWKLTARGASDALAWAPLATCGLDGEIAGPPMAALVEGFCLALAEGSPWVEACKQGLRGALAERGDDPADGDFCTTCVGLAVADDRLVPSAAQVQVHDYWRSVIGDSSRRVGLPEGCDYVPLALRDPGPPSGIMNQAEALRRHRGRDRAPHAGDVELSEIFSGSGSHVVAVVGDPGCGKTTLLQHILTQNTLAALEEEAEPAVPSPAGAEVEVAVYLHVARDVAIPGDVAAALRSREEMGLLVSGQQGHRCLLLLDALDEVPTAERDALLDDLVAWLRHPDQRQRVRCLLACRAAAFPGWGYPVLALRLLDERTLPRFVAAYNARGVLGGHSLERLGRLMRWPRFAARICETYNRAPGRLHGGLLQLFQENLRDLLRSRAYGDPRQRRETVLPPGVKQEALEALAWQLHLDREASWDRAGLMGRLERIWDDLPERVLSPGSRDRVQQALGSGLGDQLFDELSTCAGLLVPVGRDLDDVYDFADRSWWGFLAARHALRIFDQHHRGGPCLRWFAARLGFDGRRHRFDPDNEDLLLFFAEGRVDPDFLDALWRVNKTLALRCFEISRPRARAASIIHAMLLMEEQLQLYPRLQMLDGRWMALSPQRAEGTVQVDEDLVRHRILPPPGADGVVREDGRVLFWIRTLLERLRRDGAAWAEGVHGELFGQALSLDRAAMAAARSGSHRLGHPQDPDNPERSVRLSGHEVDPRLVTCEEYERLDPLHERAPGQSGDDPVAGVTWYEAAVFAERTGCELPTEAQWEAAARAGLLEDAGVAAEWCRDWFRSGYLVTCDGVEDPTGPDRGSGRVVRGKQWDADHEHRSGAARSNAAPLDRDHGLGFRCCREL